MRVLAKNSIGKDVEKLNLFFGIKNKLFTDETKKKIISFQEKNNLFPNGIVGVKTLRVMNQHGFEGSAKESLNLNFSEIWEIIEENNDKLICPANTYNSKPTAFDPVKNLIVVAIRGFKLDTMGKPQKNDRKIYDDAHFIVTPNGIISFEGNTDPNGYRTGSGFSGNKGMACLDKGVWFFGRGLHKGRPAFRQACPFRVIRDGNPPYPHTGYHAINWHDGGDSTTSSLGCQTNRPADFKILRDFIYRELVNLDNPKMFLDSADKKAPAFPYILIEEEDRRAGRLEV